MRVYPIHQIKTYNDRKPNLTSFWCKSWKQSFPTKHVFTTNSNDWTCTSDKFSGKRVEPSHFLTACLEFQNNLLCSSSLSKSNDLSIRHVVHHPEIQIKIFDVSNFLLLDSGTSIFAISGEFFTMLKNNTSILFVLPVSGVSG